MATEFDHLVVAADTLERGVAHVRACLGIECTPGGHHPAMGTHNALLGLGAARYLEVIAIDPGADPPDAPRWFALDDPAVQAALAERPRLLTWVARSTDVATTVAACRHDAGRPRPMQRGELHWRIAFPADGHLVEGGLVPPLIEWGEGVAHPADRLPDEGLRLERLVGVHPRPQRVRALLEAPAPGHVLEIETGEPAGLRAAIRTPHGTRWLE